MKFNGYIWVSSFLGSAEGIGNRGTGRGTITYRNLGYQCFESMEVENSTASKPRLVRSQVLFPFFMV